MGKLGMYYAERCEACGGLSPVDNTNQWGIDHARATLEINFGPNGKTRQGVLNGEESTLAGMILKVCHWYESRLAEMPGLGDIK